MKEPTFLTLAEVIDIHENQIRLYGGEIGIRDIGLLQSAIAQPEASFAGQWLHKDIFVMSAAYAFHICKNHAFIDGNKRAALASALVFLELNGITIIDPKQKLLDNMLQIAAEDLDKEAFAKVLRALSL